ncbi:MAG: hydroxymethylbilane synthase [Candidatus Thermoplasmatota archaeon]|nr:hydroxymethylbilane synthase [Candidatus Thermoplasmatota archaeon]
MRRLVAGSRGSRLALTQTETIANRLECEVETKSISTRGDKIHDVALAKVEGKGFFTKEIDNALLEGEVDFAVHSFKDVPTDVPDGLVIASVPERESPRDALIGPYRDLDGLPLNARVGTSSLRRRAEVLHTRPDVIVEDLRGNLDSRLRKLNEGMFDAAVVAEAGLRRLGHEDFSPLDPESFIPAACQGALAITARRDDPEVLDILSSLEHPATRLSCEGERAFLSSLESGCQVPAGVYTTIDAEATRMSITVFISSLDGKVFLRARDEGSLEDSKEVSRNLARKLLDMGGEEILANIRKEVS